VVRAKVVAMILGPDLATVVPVLDLVLVPVVGAEDKDPVRVAAWVMVREPALVPVRERVDQIRWLEYCQTRMHRFQMAM